jgi:hypothetical protein
VWANGQYNLFFIQNNVRSLWKHVHEELGHFGVWWIYNLL